MTTSATPRELEDSNADIATVLLGMHRELTRIRGEADTKLKTFTQEYSEAHDSQLRSLAALEARASKALADAQAHADMLHRHAAHAEQSANDAISVWSDIEAGLKAAAEPWARTIDIKTSERLAEFEQKISGIAHQVSTGLADIRDQTNQRTDARLAEIRAEFAGLSKLVVSDLSDMRENTKTLHGQIRAEFAGLSKLVASDLSDMRENTKTLHGQIRKVADAAAAAAARKVADMETLHQEFKARFDAHLASQAAEAKLAREAASANDLKRLNLTRVVAAIVVAACAYLVLR